MITLPRQEKIIDSPARQEIEGFLQNLSSLSEKSNFFFWNTVTKTFIMVYLHLTYQAIIAGIESKEPCEII